MSSTMVLSYSKIISLNDPFGTLESPNIADSLTRLLVEFSEELNNQLGEFLKVEPLFVGAEVVAPQRESCAFRVFDL
jgi:hypothetical protein